MYSFKKQTKKKNVKNTKLSKNWQKNRLNYLYGIIKTMLIIICINSFQMKTPRKYKTLGLLDLYGFESLAEDPGGFEQLVFNFAAEKVQRVTFEWTMVLEQQEYTLEGVEWTHLGMVSH